jgi:hypothetical protein
MNVGKEIAELKNMTVTQLRARYARVFGEETRAANKDFLVKRIAWRIQSLEEGDLSERARVRAAELARDADIRTTAPKAAPPAEPSRTVVAELVMSPNARVPMPGAQISRPYKGRMIAVTVLPNGFDYEGEVYRSLSAVAKAVTGTHWNGYHFFNLAKCGGANG